MNNETIYEIDVKQLVIDLLYKAWIVVLAAIVCAVCAYGYAKNNIEPQYTANASLYVSNISSDVLSQIQKINSSDLDSAKSLVQTYLAFMSSNKVLDEVSERCNGMYTGEQIKKMIDCSSKKDTEIFYINVTNPDPREAARIANILADMAPQIIPDYIVGSAVKIVDYAKVPTNTSFPNYTKYLLFGMVGGGGIAAFIIVLLFLFNSRVMSQDDLEHSFSAPVLVKMPSFAQIRERRENYSYRSSSRYDYDAYKLKSTEGEGRKK